MRLAESTIELTQSPLTPDATTEPAAVGRPSAYLCVFLRAGCHSRILALTGVRNPQRKPS